MILMRVARSSPRSELIGMSLTTCGACRGTGLDQDTLKLCRCVDRAVFRAVLGRYHYCASGFEYAAPVSMQRTGTSGQHGCWARVNENFKADVWLVAKRTLADAPLDWAVFRCHHLLGSDWKLCCRKLNISRGNFFHAVYRVEEKLGRVFRTLEPYPLYPLDEYFMGAVRGAKTTALLAKQQQRREPLRPPLAVAA